MKPMTGDIGKLTLDGKQVGGFRNWTVFIHLKPPIKSRVVASGWWMLEKVNTNKLVANFYAEDAGKLQLIREGEVIINLPPDYALDTLIVEPVEITFEEDFDWRD